MPPLASKDLRQFRILLLIPLLAGFYFQLTAAPTLNLREAWPDGSTQITIGKGDSKTLELGELHDNGKKSADRVIINEASHAELMGCPGIGSKTATLIIMERRHGLFFDWRDLQDRVKSMGTAKINELRDAGVKLSQ